MPGRGKLIVTDAISGTCDPVGEINFFARQQSGARPQSFVEASDRVPGVAS